jgi:asparagine synthetase B (glutamine-hydrolysing)
VLVLQVPYGILLSGGLDSSLVASVAQREYAKLGNTDKLRLVLYTVKYAKLESPDKLKLVLY